MDFDLRVVLVRGWSHGKDAWIIKENQYGYSVKGAFYICVN